MSQADRCIYTGGSIPQHAHEKRMTRELGRKPTQMKLFQKTKQTSTLEGGRRYARDHDRAIYEDYYKEMVERYGEDVRRSPELDAEAWSKAANTPSQQHPKSYIYGFGASRDISQFFPGKRGSKSQSQAQSSAPPYQAHWDTPEFRAFLREQIIFMNRELQRSGTHGVPSFTPATSRGRVRDDDDDDRGEGGGYDNGEGGGYDNGDDDEYVEHRWDEWE